MPRRTVHTTIKKPQSFLVLAALFAVLVLGSVAAAKGGACGRAAFVSDEAEAGMPAAYWEKIIDCHGAGGAYEVFKDAYRDSSPALQHSQAHVFGSALYVKERNNGVAVCDRSFSFGCYHELMGLAIHEQGFGVVPELNARCIENLGSQALGCQHGIGHGILAASGYDTMDLKGALRECGKIPIPDPISGCYGGAFMEYNMRTMLSLDGVGVRKFEDGGVYSPCEDISTDEHLPSCYYWLSDWWRVVLEGGSEEVFVEMGELCRKNPTGESVRDECFQGIGSVAVLPHNYDPAGAIALCRAAAKGADEELWCRTRAAESFYAVDSVRDRYRDVCEGLPSADREQCINRSGMENRPS